MTDKDIIKALKYCQDTEGDSCQCCSYYGTSGCQIELLENALDLINRQQAEIERLKNSYKQCAYERDVFLRENPVEMALLIDEQAEKLKTIKAEAIKEFADRLKTLRFGKYCDYFNFEITNAIIDNLVKEMVGEGK